MSNIFECPHGFYERTSPCKDCEIERLRGLVSRAALYIGDETGCADDCAVWLAEPKDCTCGRVDLLYDLCAPENAPPDSGVVVTPAGPNHEVVTGYWPGHSFSSLRATDTPSASAPKERLVVGQGGYDDYFADGSEKHYRCSNSGDTRRIKAFTGEEVDEAWCTLVGVYASKAEADAARPDDVEPELWLVKEWDIPAAGDQPPMYPCPHCGADTEVLRIDLSGWKPLIKCPKCDRAFVAVEKTTTDKS
jgi:hypothetical protein